MDNTEIKYFLAANSSEGFVSHFSECYDPLGGWRVYIIKGGPGTGKSSFMKHLAFTATQRKEKMLLCPCSSDPDSLDGIIFPNKKTVFLDGTAPHTLDPVYPGACEEILNFGEFWDTKALLAQKADIIKITDRNKALHKTASANLKAAGEIMADNFKTAAACTDSQKAKSFALKLCRKHIKPQNSGFKENMLFLTGTTPKGVISFTNTALNMARLRIIINDSLGFASTVILQEIRKYCIQNGIEFITVKNPFLPSLMTDGVIIPSLSLCFMREYEYSTFKCDDRRIHSRRFTNAKQLSKSRKRIRFNKKAVNELLQNAISVLNEAKSVHDDLEKCYRKAMNFERLTAYAAEFEKELFSL